MAFCKGRIFAYFNGRMRACKSKFSFRSFCFAWFLLRQENVEKDDKKTKRDDFDVFIRLL